MIKLATHSRDMKKDVAKKFAKTTDYNTVAFKTGAVAIDYTLSSNNI
ncbi:MAG: hypothetical protein R6W88_16300 [Desulfobacterales bacterium]